MYGGIHFFDQFGDCSAHLMLGQIRKIFSDFCRRSVCPPFAVVKSIDTIILFIFKAN